VVAARWNAEVTARLASGAVAAARDAGAAVDSFTVAGSFELPAAVAALADTGAYDAVVPVGCLIKGETPHFEYIASAVSQGLMELSITYPAAVPFGVLTCNTVAQAKARAGGRLGNQGAEAMEAALEMVALYRTIASSRRRSSRIARTASSTRTS
ncbi:MAG: 6,7-dimethyl-8-ribityllumazine synthase, partial [Chloroflexota bacterium]|nr:6,7-dimethyl-8-ribityllumazine synthase [Chloroflexota bacterium]